jgi:hypothetical protein
MAMPTVHYSSTAEVTYYHGIFTRGEAGGGEGDAVSLKVQCAKV